MSPSSRRPRTPARSPRRAGTCWRSVSRQVLAGGLTLGLGMAAFGYAAATDLSGVDAGYAAQSAVSAPSAGVMVAGVDRPLLGAPVSRAHARAALTAEQLRTTTAATAKAKAEAAARAQAEAAAKAKAAAERVRQQAIASARADPKAAARTLMAEFGWADAGQQACLATLWTGESDWRYTAENPSSGAYGIPQALPASKMAQFGADYRTNPLTQIRWGLWYIQQSYGTPCGALSFWQAKSPHWY